MRHAFLLTLIATLLGCWTPGWAANAPAKLVEGERSIEALVSLPVDLKPGRYTVHCETFIVPTGHARLAFCYPSGEQAPPDLIRAVNEAVAKAKYVPAVREGKATDVYAVLMVLVDTTLGEPMILAVLNNGVERQRYGLLYTAPQRIVNERAVDTASISWSGTRLTQLVTMRFRVDEHGTVNDLKMENVSGEDPITMRSYERAAREYRFLPGYHDDRPVPMFHVEPHFSIPSNRYDRLESLFDPPISLR